VHERLSTEVIIESLTGHKKDEQKDLFDLFGDARRPLAERVLKAYEYRDRWVNRMILGDSLVAMNSLLQYEGMGGQVQMIYIDPPYGVKFGSNFQPFVRKHQVKNNDDADLTREPEMVQAYRDTWELGLHSYLTYLRDRLLLAKDLLTPSGSVFVQISDENLHHVREVMDEVFGAENRCAVITFAKTTGADSPSGGTDLLPQTSDYLLWYARTRDQVKFRQTYLAKVPGGAGATQYTFLDLPEGRRQATAVELQSHPAGAKLFAHDNLTSQTGGPTTQFVYEFGGQLFAPSKGGWKTNLEGMRRLDAANRLFTVGNTLRYVRYLADFALTRVDDYWHDTIISGFGAEKLYVVQTTTRVVERCMLMTTDPGDLVLDPTCGSGTTAYVAEQWGRRWITMDTSRVPLALARQRLLTASFPWYQLNDDTRGPASGFTYTRKQNARGEEVGGLVPHVTLKSIANDEPPTMEVLVDRPEEDCSVTRVTGPFAFEATIPTPIDWEGDGEEDSAPGASEAHGNFVDRMLEVLRRSPRLQLGGSRVLEVDEVRAPGRAQVGGRGAGDGAPRLHIRAVHT
jgi:adenine-specific DNA-methyltransferase